MNKMSLAAAALVLAAHSLWAGGDLEIKKIVLNGNAQSTSIAAKKNGGHNFPRRLASGAGAGLHAQTAKRPGHSLH